jgi:hypothetical protein
MGEGRNVYRDFVGDTRKNLLKDKGVDGRMGAKWTLWTLVAGFVLDSPGPG